MDKPLIQTYYETSARALDLTKPQHKADLEKFVEGFEKRFSDYTFLEAWHAIDVLNYLIILSSKLNVRSMELLCPAALMHDIKDLEPEHNLRGAEEANRILRELNYDSSLAEGVAKLIEHHRYKENKEKDYSIENKMLIDADVLSKFSFIGRYRSLLLQEKSKREEWLQKRYLNIEEYIDTVKSWFRLKESKELFKADEMFLFFYLLNQA